MIIRIMSEEESSLNEIGKEIMWKILKLWKDMRNDKSFIKTIA